MSRVYDVLLALSIICVFTVSVCCSNMLKYPVFTFRQDKQHQLTT